MLEKPTEQTLTRNRNCKTASQILITEQFERGRIILCLHVLLVQVHGLVHLVHLTDSHGWFTWLFYLADSLDSVQEKWWVVDCVVHCCITGLCPLPTQQRFCFGGGNFKYCNLQCC